MIARLYDCTIGRVHEPFFADAHKDRNADKDKDRGRCNHLCPGEEEGRPYRSGHCSPTSTTSQATRNNYDNTLQLYKTDGSEVGVVTWGAKPGT
jgi:hypothetical protein